MIIHAALSTGTTTHYGYNYYFGYTCNY